ncbi:MAG: hypothetical protein NC401_19980, partial [Ruminococcus sp.]|nr:hypothetical protein [Ruminococcus sp.]
MASFKIKNNKLQLNCELGNTADFIKNVLESNSEYPPDPELYKSIINTVSSLALKNLDGNYRIMYLEHLRKFTEGFNIALKKLSPKKGYHYFIKDKHLGDAARTLQLISVFKKHHKENDTFPIEKTVVETYYAIADLGRIYPDINEFIVLDREELSCLIYFLRNIESGIYNFYLDDCNIGPHIKSEYLLPGDFTLSAEMLRLPDKLDECS